MTPAVLADVVRSAAVDVLSARGLDAAALPVTVTVERPRNGEHGDYATNIALRTAKRLGVPASDLAAWLAEALRGLDALSSVEVAEPGFLNLRLTADATSGILLDISSAGAGYGTGTALAGLRIELELVSADPTGPVRLGHARVAAVGEALGRVFAAQGAEVTMAHHLDDFQGGRTAAIAGEVFPAGATGCGDAFRLAGAGVRVRVGTAATVADMVDAVGEDALRYALVRSSVDSTLDIDVELLARQVNGNPAYHVLFANARACSLLRGAADLGIDTGRDPVDLSLLDGELEGELVRTLGELPRVVGAAAELREPHRVARYLERLATVYHRFHDAHRVLPQGEESPTEVTAARLALCGASRQVLGNGLALLGVSAPERM